VRVLEHDEAAVEEFPELDAQAGPAPVVVDAERGQAGVGGLRRGATLRAELADEAILQGLPQPLDAARGLGGETLTMSQKEAPRIGLLKALVAAWVIGREVATALGVTVRQVWRLKRRVESAGAAGLLHRHGEAAGGRGTGDQPPHRPPLRQTLGRPARHRRRPRRYHARREPPARMGALVQLDASPFAWLEDRGPAMSLYGAIALTTQARRGRVPTKRLVN
jgi:hypothetical protein